MSRVLKFPDPRLEQEQAATWIARLDRGLRGSEQEQLQAWLAEDARHRPALLEVARLCDRMDMLAEMAELFPLQREAVGSRWSRAWLPAAGLVAVVGVLVSLFEFRLRTGRAAGDAVVPVSATHATTAVNGTAPDATPFVASYSTAVGEQRAVVLPDHSTIRLNTNTALQVKYSATARLLEMTRGEANFEVAKDPARLFTVRVAGFDFNAVGTAFNIRADSSRGVRLTVTEGRVRIHRAPQSEPAGGQSGAARSEPTEVTEVEANKEVVIGQSSERIAALRTEQVAVATAWQRGMLAFEATPLQQVVAELARYSTTHFVIEDAEIGRVPVSGYFKIGDLDALAAVLQQNFGIAVQKSNNQVLLSAGPSK
jgi:transmembrane sensor